MILALSAPTDAGPAIDSYAAGLRRMSGVYHVSGPRDLGRHTWEIESMLVARRSHNTRRVS